MYKRWMWSFLPALIIGLGVQANAQSTAELLEKGIYTEETVGDLDRAIAIYQEIVDQAATNRAYVAKAQFRLGRCLQKQGKQTEAIDVLQALVEQFKDNAELEPLLQQARKLLPTKSPLELIPIPWKDGESTEMRIKLGSDLQIGDFIFSVRREKLDEHDVWRMNIVRNVVVNAPNLGFSEVVADAKTFAPIRSRFQHTLLGTVDAEYAPSQVTVQPAGDEAARNVDLDKLYYDNEQGWWVFRRLPLAADYRGTVPIHAAFGAGLIPLECEVTGTETVNTPVGEFECFKMFVKPVQQTFWISTDEQRQLVKFEAGGVIGELTSVRYVTDSETIKLNGKELPFTVTAPANWYFFPMKDSDEKTRLHYVPVDPKAQAVASLSIKPAESLPADQRESVRAWADAVIAESIKEAKQFKVRPESWEDFEIGGLPAVRCIADFVIGEKQRSQYHVLVLGKSTAALFFGNAVPDQLDDYARQVDVIMNSYREN